MIKAEVFEVRPVDFCSKVEVAACYLPFDKKILLLQRPSFHEEAGCWGVPGGKLERGEAPLLAAKRELKEETGIDVSLEKIISLGEIYYRKMGLDFVFHLFHVQFTEIPSIILSPESQDYMWAPFEGIEKLPLLAGGNCSLHIYQSRMRRAFL